MTATAKALVRRCLARWSQQARSEDLVEVSVVVAADQFLGRQGHQLARQQGMLRYR